MIDCDCPRCGSRNTKALAVLYQDGTRTSDYRRDGVFYYRRSVGIHTSRTRGRSQTLTAQSAAPPAGATLSPGLVVFVLLIGAVFGAIGFWVALGLLVAVAILPAFAASGTTESRQRAWSSTFRCSRCGTVFAVMEDTPQGEQISDLRNGLHALSIVRLITPPTRIDRKL